MNFSDLRKKASELNGAQTVVSNLKDYEAIALLYIGKVKELEDIKGKEFEYLFSDIIERDCGINFQAFFGQKIYISASQYAYGCLEIELKCKYLKPSQVSNWTRNALHCFDHIIIHYINDILKETVTQIGSWFKETFNYEHLIKKGGNLAEIGAKFKSIYQLRSEFEHIQYKDSEPGKILIRNLSNKKKQEKLRHILQSFKIALEHFHSIYLNLNLSLGH